MLGSCTSIAVLSGCRPGVTCQKAVELPSGGVAVTSHLCSAPECSGNFHDKRMGGHLNLPQRQERWVGLNCLADQLGALRLRASPSTVRGSCITDSTIASTRPALILTDYGNSQPARLTCTRRAECIFCWDTHFCECIHTSDLHTDAAYCLPYWYAICRTGSHSKAYRSNSLHTSAPATWPQPACLPA